MNRENYDKDWRKDHEDELMEDLDSGFTIDQLAMIYERTPDSIRLKIRQLYIKANEKRQRQIKQFIIKRKIKQLIHFTDARNLDSISKHGILSVQKLKETGTHYYYNDGQRLDKHLNGVSVSITSINHYLLANFHRRENRQWLEISLKPEVLFINKCLFYDYNAATNKFMNKINEELYSFEALRGMFAEKVIVKRIHTRENKLINQPTCVQAEVIVIGAIAKSQIIRIQEAHV